MTDNSASANVKTSAPDPDKAKTPKDIHEPARGDHGKAVRITITEDGPYIVEGDVALTEDAICPSEDGSHLEYHRVRELEVGEKYALCRCGHSSSMPFCDGTHRKIEFNGEEVADKAPYLKRADEYPGPELDLLDDNRCAFARLCHRGGRDVWTLTEQARETEEACEAIGGSWNCPTGRLENHDAETGKVYEQRLPIGITILEDPQQGVSGPLFMHGDIELVGADGASYERRMRYALCRCGESQNKPFCDAMHVNAGFYDASEAFSDDWEGVRDDSFEDMPESL